MQSVRALVIGVCSLLLANSAFAQVIDLNKFARVAQSELAQISGKDCQRFLKKSSKDRVVFSEALISSGKTFKEGPSYLYYLRPLKFYRYYLAFRWDISNGKTEIKLVTYTNRKGITSVVTASELTALMAKGIEDEEMIEIAQKVISRFAGVKINKSSTGQRAVVFEAENLPKFLSAYRYLSKLENVESVNLSSDVTPPNVVEDISTRIGWPGVGYKEGKVHEIDLNDMRRQKLDEDAIIIPQNLLNESVRVEHPLADADLHEVYRVQVRVKNQAELDDCLDRLEKIGVKVIGVSRLGDVALDKSSVTSETTFRKDLEGFSCVVGLSSAEIHTLPKLEKNFKGPFPLGTLEDTSKKQ